ncbi:MAG: hypothetical protein WC389_16930 [Lutibacter sp.]|jgi:hypothetical protein
MRKSNTKTSLKITMESDGGASINLKWDDRDSTHQTEASERLIVELIKITGYKWLENLVKPYIVEKYCNKCKYHGEYEVDLAECIESQNNLPFPYGFEENNSEIKIIDPPLPDGSKTQTTTTKVVDNYFKDEKNDQR